MTFWKNKVYKITLAFFVVLLIAGGGLAGVLITSMDTRSDLIPVGQMAPEFTATASDGSTVKLVALRGKRVVLVFYPGDYTPGCTAQLCSFRDNWQALQAENTVVYGVNPAGKTAHAGFVALNKLPFPLIVDSNNDIARAYGCRALFGIVKRTVYVIDSDGTVVFAKRGSPSPKEILAALSANPLEKTRG